MTTPHSLRVALFAGACLALAACGTDDDSTGALPGDGADAGFDTSDVGGSDTADAGADSGGAVACVTAEASGTAATGIVYTDADASERSLWDGGAFATPDSPAAGRTVALIGADGRTETATCSDGTFAFSNLDATGIYVTDMGWDDDELCRTRNCARRFPQAVARGNVKIVTVGDSVPKVGDAPFFPARLADILAPLTNVENVNIAVPGTLSVDWVPGTANFDDRLAPHVPSADVVVVSIGGNDFLNYANGAFSDPQGAIAGFPDFVREVMGRVLSIKDEVHTLNPEADLVYLLYPNYSESDMWADQFSIAIGIISDLVLDALEQLLNELEMEEDIILVDFYGYFRETGLDLDDHLYDLLHFNDAGQEVYAERLFEALGGVRFGDDPVGVESRFALSAQ